VRRISEPHPDPLRALLVRQPALLAAVDSVALFLRRLRTELGDAAAHSVLIRDPDEWARLCQAGSEAEIEAWIFARKTEALGQELRQDDLAKSLFRKVPELRADTVPQLIERCAAIREVLAADNKALLAALGKQPDNLLAEPTAFAESLAALKTVFEPTAARQWLRQRPELLTLAEEVTAVFAKVHEWFPDVARTRLRERTSGEWARWPDMVEVTEEALHAWLGRLAFEERSATCKDRVSTFGARVPQPPAAPPPPVEEAVPDKKKGKK